MSAVGTDRVRVHYAKRGRARFTSHRDFARALERAVRRAGLPVAYSAGFSPHPKISYLGAAPTGVASEAEYLEIGLAEPVDPQALADRLGPCLPDGLDVVECVPAGAEALADRIDASAWRIEFGPDDGAVLAGLRAAVEEFTGRDSVEVQRLTKNGRKTIDARAAIVTIQARDGAANPSPGADPPSCAILDVVVRLVTPAVRPDDVLAALRAVAELAPPAPALVTRVAQGRVDDTGRLTDPLAPDRTAARSVGEDARPMAPRPASSAV